jgi:hypothetical protein
MARARPPEPASDEPAEEPIRAAHARPPAKAKGGPRNLANLFEKRKKRPKDDKPSGWSGGIAIHPSILAGLAMMVGAAIWFFVALAAGYIYFYPPVLFVLGIVSIVAGFRGTE